MFADTLLLIVMISSSSSMKKEDGKMRITGLFDEAVKVGDGVLLGRGRIRARCQ